MKLIGHSFLGLMVALPLAVGCDVMDDSTAEGEELGSLETSSETSSTTRAATLRNAAGTAVARVTFTPIGGGNVLVSTTINFPGIAADFHGMHIHANDNPANGTGCIADPAQPANTHFVAVDGHWNPDGVAHGAHAGDMPSPLVLDNGTAFASFVNTISPLDEIVGRAVILHEQRDNFGNIPLGTAPNQYTANAQDAITLTANTGNAGNRIACGVIR